MRLWKIMLAMTMIAISPFSFADKHHAVNQQDFFEVGKSYLFLPRANVIMKGTVTQLTPYEVVFTDRYYLKPSSKESANGDNNNIDAARMHGSAILTYLKSKDKASLLEAAPLKDIPTSYSRAEMTAVKLSS